MTLPAVDDARVGSTLCALLLAVACGGIGVADSFDPPPVKEPFRGVVSGKVKCRNRRGRTGLLLFRRVAGFALGADWRREARVRRIHLAADALG